MNPIETKIQCPFFLYELNTSIVCEGYNSKSKELYLITEPNKQKWLKVVCCEDYKSCSRYQKIMKEKYSDERKIVNG